MFWWLLVTLPCILVGGYIITMELYAFLYTLIVGRKVVQRPPGRLRSGSVGMSAVMCSGPVASPLNRSAGFDKDCVISCRVVVDALPTQEKLRMLLEKLRRHSRMNSIPVMSDVTKEMIWAPVPFDVEAHVHHKTVTSLRELERLTTELMNSKLHNPALPLWEVVLVDIPDDAKSTGPVERGVGVSLHPAIFFRIHHAIGDGLSMAQMFMDVLESPDTHEVLHGGFGGKLGKVTSAEADVSGSPTPQPRSPTSKSDAASPFPTSSPTKPAPESAAKKPEVKPKKKPASPQEKVIKLLKLPFLFLRDIGVVILQVLPAIWVDTPNIFCDTTKTVAGRDQVFVEFPSHPLSLIKRIKKSLQESGAVPNATINDIEFAILTGCMQRCSAKFNMRIPQDAMVRASVPLAFPQDYIPETKYLLTLRNGFVFITAPLPVAGGASVNTATKRVNESSKIWGAIKRSATYVPAHFAAYWLLNFVPLWVKRYLGSNQQLNTSMIFSNVPGPQQPCAIAGARVLRAHVAIPTVAPCVELISVDGVIHVCGSLYSDIVDPYAIATAFEDELIGMCEEVCGMTAEEARQELDSIRV